MAKVKATLRINKALIDVQKGEQSVMNECVRQALTEIAQHWKEAFLPLHFMASAPGRYGDVYTPRTDDYMKRKERYRHHQRPMVWSGTMRAEIIGQAGTISHRATGASRRVTLRLYSRRMNLWAGNGRKHDFAAELSAISGEELKRFSQWLQERTMDLFYQRINSAGFHEETYAA